MTSIADIIGQPGVAGARITVDATAPTTAIDGDLWYDLGRNLWFRYDDTVPGWASMAQSEHLAVGATAPATPVANDLWYDTSVNWWKRWDGTGWIEQGPIDAGTY